MGGRRKNNKEGRNEFPGCMESHLEERISQWEGRAGDDLVRSMRVQHNDCGETNDSKMGPWTCFTMPGSQARRFGGII